MNCYNDYINNKFYHINKYTRDIFYCLNPFYKGYEGFYFYLEFKNNIGSLRNDQFNITNLLHRTDGPAIEYANGHKLWYIHGEGFNCKSQEEFEKILKMKAFI